MGVPLNDRQVVSTPRACRGSLENSGNAPGVVDISDPMPGAVESWALVDAGGGTDASTLDTLIIEGIALAANESSEVIFDVVVAEVPDGTVMTNIAVFSAPPDEDQGELVAPPVFISNVGGDGDGDSGDGDGDGDGDSGDGDGDSGDGDGDGDSGDGDGDGDSGESGSETGDEGGTTGTEVGDSAETDTGETGPGVNLDGEGCNCASEPPRHAGGLALLALLALRRRRRSLA